MTPMDNAGAEVVFEGREVFAQPIHRAVLRDRRLSWGARGLFAFLWDLPDGWKLRSSHLAGMGPDGLTAVRSRLGELEVVQALRQEPLKDPETGRLAGKRWVVRSPVLWAVEAPLSPLTGAKNADSTEGEVFRSSGNPIIVNSQSKVYQSEGSPIQSTTTPSKQRRFGGGGLDEEQIQAHVEAGLFAAARGETPVRNRQKLAAAIRRRISEDGPSALDVADLAAWQEHQVRQAHELKEEAQATLEESIKASREAELSAGRKEALEAFLRGSKEDRKRLMQIASVDAIDSVKKNLEAARQNFEKAGDLRQLKPLAKVALARAAMSLRPSSAPSGA